MPELPEVETVRRGLRQWAVGRTVAEVEVRHPRSVRRHPAGPADFAARLTGRTLVDACRRGKFVWLPLDSTTDAGEALVGHLGMSGQLLVPAPETADEPHLRVRLRFRDGGRDLRFVDQRTFGALAVDTVEDDADGAGGADDPGVPSSLRHVARDPFDPAFDDAAFVDRLRRRHTGLKRALLDQTLISGVGNIYADEALWLAQLHWARPTETMRRPELGRLLAALRAVLTSALEAGGTSFDSLYVNVNGESGYFDRELHAYGRRDQPCARCRAPIRRDSFMNRSSFTCPRCQPRPRRARF